MSLDLIIHFVESPEKSAAFYKRLFHLEPLELSPTFALFALPGGLKLGLWSPKTAEPPASVGGGGHELCFSVDNVDELYQKWKAQGLSFLQPPTDMDFGRTFVATDPDGYRLRVYRLSEN